MRNQLLVSWIIFTGLTSHSQMEVRSIEVDVFDQGNDDSEGSEDGAGSNYTGYSVIRAQIKDDTSVHLLEELGKSLASRVDFWKRPTYTRPHVDIQVSPDVRQLVLAFLKRKGIGYDVIIDDLQHLIDNERPLVVERRATLETDEDSKRFNLGRYHSHDEIMDWLDTVDRDCIKCQLIDIGTSFEGRPIKMIKIAADPSKRKPAIWIDAGIHAREWIAPAIALYIINELVNGEGGRQSSLADLSRDYDFYILPLANPDGYQHSWTRRRLWRKTRSIINGSRCRGVDPNRNWDFHWGAGLGSSAYPCDADFRGYSPFSEPEVRAMRDALLDLGDQVVVYLSLHSYGQYLLTPWGFTTDLPDDYEEMMQIGNEVVRVLKRSGANYSVGASSHLLYLAPGGSDDWAKGIAGIKYSYTIELGDTGHHGFLLPPEHIEPTGRQMVAALRAVAKTLKLKQRKKFLAASKA